MDKFLRVQRKDGKIINVNANKPDYGYVIVGQMRLVVGKGSWLKPQKLTALMPVKLSDFDGIELSEKDIFPGKIYVQESLDAFEGSDPEKYIKRKGKDGDVITHLGSPVYRKCFHTYDMEQQYELLESDVESVATVSANSNFDEESPL